MTKLRANGQQLRILTADLRAANWVYANREAPDEMLLQRFTAIHAWFLKHIRRPGPVDFTRLDRTRLLDVVRKWMSLYSSALAAHRARYPYTEHTTDLFVSDVNWSRRLGISYEGLLSIGIPSRYAEYWAELSVRSDTMCETFFTRLEFVGSQPDEAVRELKARGEMLIVDPKTSNGIPSFDLYQALCGRGGCGVEVAIEARGYRILDLSPAARKALAVLVD